MKRILLVQFSQTGQLASMADAFAAPLAQTGVEVERCVIAPQTPYPFPWPFWRFFNTFPETVHLKPAPIQPPVLQHEHYDAVVIAYTVWFLSPAQPITAFLQSGAAEVLKDTPVITLIGCRNMWLMAQEVMKKLIAARGGRLIGNIVKIDGCSSAASFIATPMWMLTGRKKLRGLPEAGVPQKEIADCSRFGAKLADVLGSGQPLDASLYRGMGAAPVNERLIFSEKAARRSFYLWGKLLMSAGRLSGVLRRVLLLFYVIFLVALILTVVPLSAVIKRLLRPLMQKKIAAQKAYYSQPSGE